MCDVATIEVMCNFFILLEFRSHNFKTVLLHVTTSPREIAR